MGKDQGVDILLLNKRLVSDTEKHPGLAVKSGGEFCTGSAAHLLYDLKTILPYLWALFLKPGHWVKVIPKALSLLIRLYYNTKKKKTW